MKDLIFTISYRDHTFTIRTRPRSTLCYYDIEGKYTTSLIFATNTYASVDHKNVHFCGRATKQDIWRVDIGFRSVLWKRYDRIYYLSSKATQSKEENAEISNDPSEFPDKILRIYDQLIEFLQEYYLCIEDKETFKKQLCESLVERYSYDEIGDLDRIVEYENWDDVGPDDDPIIENISLKEYLIKEHQENFIRFRQAEIDNKSKEDIITLDNVIQETPSLLEYPYESLKNEFCKFWYKNIAESIKPDIWYSQEDVLIDIGEELSECCEYALFIDTVEERIDMILSSLGIENIDKDGLYSELKSYYAKDSLPSEEEFVL